MMLGGGSRHGVSIHGYNQVSLEQARSRGRTIRIDLGNPETVHIRVPQCFRNIPGDDLIFHGQPGLLYFHSRFSQGTHSHFDHGQQQVILTFEFGQNGPGIFTVPHQLLRDFTKGLDICNRSAIDFDKDIIGFNIGAGIACRPAGLYRGYQNTLCGFAFPFLGHYKGHVPYRNSPVNLLELLQFIGFPFDRGDIDLQILPASIHGENGGVPNGKA